MARHLRGIGRKDHCPGNIGWSSVQLRVDEVADPSEEQTGCAGESERIGDRPERQSTPSREQGAGGHHAEHGAVKGKSTMPDREHVERMRGVLCRVVY